MHTPDFLLDTSQRKHQRDHLIFYRTVSAHTIQFFIADKKLDLPFYFLFGVSIGTHCPILYRSYCVVTKASWITSFQFFIGLQLVQVTWFPLRFIVYDKKSGCVHWTWLTSIFIAWSIWLWPHWCSAGENDDPVSELWSGQRCPATESSAHLQTHGSPWRLWEELQTSHWRRAGRWSYDKYDERIQNLH